MIIPIIDIVLLPGMNYNLPVNHLTDNEIEMLLNDNKEIIALPLKNKKKRSELNTEDFNKIGVSIVVDELKTIEKDHVFQVIIKKFVEVSNLVVTESLISGEVTYIDEIVDINEQNQYEIMEYIKKIALDISEKFRNSQESSNHISNIDNLNILIGDIVKYLPLSNNEKYSIMETLSLKERSLLFIDYFLRSKETLQIQIEMSKRFNEKANKQYREAALKEQLRLIQEELQDGKPKAKEKEYSYRIEKANMPDEIKAVALEELQKFENQSQSSPDYNVIRNYLDFILALPWHINKEEVIDIIESRRILNEQHYGLEKVKDRIIQHLAVMKMKKDKKGSILLLVGPPGTGKTSLGKSIADALGREYIRLSLGGIRDEAEIRGHRRTYVGALPGRILASIKKAGSMNPVMVLDEVDKLMTGYNGDPASALLEVLDPEQNNTFTDHYLDLPYDLSNVLFIATANSLANISRPLLDRMEIIEVSSYTSKEKYCIAKDHLIKKSTEEHGLTEHDLQIEDETLKKIIEDYTLEAGVRGLKKRLDALSRVTAEKVVLGNIKKPFIIKPEDLQEYLGKKVKRHNLAQDSNPPGVVTGLAWTSVGGEILFIEAKDMIGNGQITLTGKLGEVMKESAKISLSILKSRFPINTASFKEKDLHIHVPSGAVPKDGPSAGIALFTALASLATGIQVSGTTAMTGEITLSGLVLPIGGLKEKLIAAQRAGIKKVLIPKDNEVDLSDVPQEVNKQLDIILVETVEDVLKESLGITLPNLSKVSWLLDDNQVPVTV
ncbi:endopeptidase La [Alkalibaculum sp. M08DMB]|uniref:Lon protease n=1 Tax=Alkalibaculum sporogenes TaxID=2655001 RepID=A0A6A7K4V6_9FIRM|nr:endopeptidase La [Alkalibaculum sporogenes]MPW24415.1 endopeptidase La [Alkalibaculum sporogenes]